MTQISTTAEGITVDLGSADIWNISQNPYPAIASILDGPYGPLIPLAGPVSALLGVWWNANQDDIVKSDVGFGVTVIIPWVAIPGQYWLIWFEPNSDPNAIPGGQHNGPRSRTRQCARSGSTKAGVLLSRGHPTRRFRPTGHAASGLQPHSQWRYRRGSGDRVQVRTDPRVLSAWIGYKYQWHGVDYMFADRTGNASGRPASEYISSRGCEGSGPRRHCLTAEDDEAPRSSPGTARARAHARPQA